jgi:hypothetical protein
MLTIHRLSTGNDADDKAIREVHTLRMQIQQIMKGSLLVFNLMTFSLVGFHFLCFVWSLNLLSLFWLQ